MPQDASFLRESDSLAASVCGLEGFHVLAPASSGDLQESPSLFTVGGDQNSAAGFCEAVDPSHAIQGQLPFPTVSCRIISLGADNHGAKYKLPVTDVEVRNPKAVFWS